MCNKLYTLSLIVVLALSGCKSETPTEEEEMINLLSRTWKAQEGQFVTWDGEDVSVNFSGFSLQLSGDKTFNSSNGNDPVWPEVGAYVFENNGDSKNLNKLVRDDGVVISIHTLSNSKFRFSFFYRGSEIGGRVKAVDGEFVFDLVAD